MKLYLGFVVPTVTRLTTRHAASQLLCQYYWDTIESCVPVQTVTAALTAAGFVNVRHDLALGMFSEYTAQRP